MEATPQQCFTRSTASAAASADAIGYHSYDRAACLAVVVQPCGLLKGC